MKHILRLEYIGADQDARKKLQVGIIREVVGPGMANLFKMPSRKPWVAEIVGKSSKYWFEREFLKPSTDYSTANGVGSRGTMLIFLVEDGHVYEIQRHDSWRSSRRYFAQWRDGAEVVLTKEEVEEWLNSKEVPDKTF